MTGALREAGTLDTTLTAGHWHLHTPVGPPAGAWALVGNISEEETTGYGDSEHAGNRGRHQRPLMMAQRMAMGKCERVEMCQAQVHPTSESDLT